MERTLLILKPDAVQRRLIGRIISRFEDKGLTIIGCKLMQIDADLAGRHYAPHQGKPFYPGLIKYITSSPVMVMVVEGERAVEISRKLMGKTFGFEAEPGTIRGDFSMSMTYNLIHGSDSPESAETEVALYFTPAELLSYQTAAHQWTVKKDET